jgi:hypothetical protein
MSLEAMLFFFSFSSSKHLKYKMSAITQAEKQKFAEIFQARGQINGYMSG